MLTSIRAALRPLVFIVLFTMTSAGTVLAENSYGGTDPPKTNDAIADLSCTVDETADAPSLWTQLSALFSQWFAAMD